jgi:hypothetical protein
MHNAGGKYIEPGADIYYEERGKGSCTLLVPGWTFATQAFYIANYAQQFMVQRKLKREELTWLVEQSSKSAPWVATLLYASAVFSNCAAEARLIDKKKPSLFILAEHWACSAKG